MGDSLAVGVLALEGYAPRYDAFAASDTGRMVTLTDLGRNGWHSGDLLNALRTDPNFRNAVARSQVVTWDIGGDDLLHAVGLFQRGMCGGPDNQDCLRAAVATFISNWDAIVAEILVLRDPQRTILRTMDVYNPFIAQELATGTFNVVKPYLEQVDAHIAASAAANHIQVAAVYRTFNGPNGDEDPLAKGYIAFDGIHPNDTGHKVIADLLRNLRYAPLQ